MLYLLLLFGLKEGENMQLYELDKMRKRYKIQMEKLKQQINDIKIENNNLKAENKLLKEHIKSVDVLQNQYESLIEKCETMKTQLNDEIKEVQKLKADMKKDYEKLIKSQRR